MLKIIWASKFRYKFAKAVLTQSWARRGEIGSSQKQIENVVDVVLKDVSESSSSKPASAAPEIPAVDVAGLRRAKRVNTQLDILSASIGKAYGILVRQPDQGGCSACRPRGSARMHELSSHCRCQS